MQFDQVEQLKKRYTGQYVKADASRPDLTRFQNAVGQIKTVNMNGRALVEFDQDSNHGWYDIPLDCLTVVDKPEPPKAPPKAPPGAGAQATAKAAARPVEPKAEQSGPPADKQ